MPSPLARCTKGRETRLVKEDSGPQAVTNIRTSKADSNFIFNIIDQKIKLILFR
jgi:hypothetical protein